jgi:hypothetical protein
LPKVAPKQVEPTWASETIQVVADDGLTRVTAFVLGALAVHRYLGAVHDSGRRVGRGEGWTVTHAATGLALAFPIKEVGDALRIGELLWSRCRPALEAAGQRGVYNSLPPWALKWIRACRAAGRWVEPERGE